MKRVLAMAAAACMVLALAGCKPGATSSQTPDAGGTDPSGNGSQVNPDGAHAALKFPAEDFNLGGEKDRHRDMGQQSACRPRPARHPTT